MSAMKEISHSVYYDGPERFLARIPDETSHSFHDRRGLESRIFARRARALDTSSLEEQLDVIVRAEFLFLGNGSSTNPMNQKNPESQS